MSIKSVLDETCLLLDSYRGRDKVLRTLCYCSKLIGGIHSNDVISRKLFTFSKAMSITRTTLRLMDDLPMLKYSLEYGFGSEEPDKLMSTLGVLTNIIDQGFYPIEKICWLAEHNLVSGLNNSKWDTASSICWVVSIYLTLLKTLMHIRYLQIEKADKLAGGESSNIEKIEAKQRYELLTSLRMTLDLVHAINTLPSGFLWSSKLETWHVGLIGTLSSILGMYQFFSKRNL